MAIDPVCKMNIEEASAQHKTTYQGKTYFFVPQRARMPLKLTRINI
ncbi:MAG: YHS domain-containing protein [Candidatus Methanoperedens sp.]|nr:YHS domain-containing protein [Candidatus Methanoperedens sp.]